MAADMDPEEMEEWRTIFNLFDVDGDESITCEVNIKTVQMDRWLYGLKSFRTKTLRKHLMFNNRHDILMFNIKKKLSEILSKFFLVVFYY